jgi:rSAM/selenodomain-associated transferase 1
MNKENLLIIFARNPVLGKVKTRLARDVGAEKALEVYLKLLEHAHKTADQVACTKHVYYSDGVDEFGLLDYFKFEKRIQEGSDLGERMNNAIKSGLDEGFQNVIIIGSDCIEITPQLIEDAFETLSSHDCVLGPANDGGYYLIGMSDLHPGLFKDKKWSSADVLLDSILDLQNEGLTYKLLATLNDIDTKDDLDQVKDLIAG